MEREDAAAKAETDRKVADRRQRRARGEDVPTANDPTQAVALREGQRQEARDRGWNSAYWDQRLREAQQAARRTPLTTLMPAPRTRRLDRRPSGGRPAAPAARRRASTRAGPDPDSDQPDPESALALARQAARLRRRYPRAEDLLAAFDRFWGGCAHRSTADGRVHRASCPSCLSKARRGWDRFPICVAETGAADAYVVAMFCACSPGQVERALIAAERDRLGLELLEIERGTPA